MAPAGATFGRYIPPAMPIDSSSPPPLLVAHNGAAIFGGAERWAVRLLVRLQERGNRVLFLCRDEEIRRRAEAFGVPAAVAHLGGHASVHDAARLAARLRRIRPDGLLLTTFKKTWLGGMAAHLAGVPRVVARIGLSTDRPGRRRVYRIAFGRWIDRVVVNADGLREGILQDLPGLPPRRVITLYNGVDPTPRRAPEGAVRRELGIPDGAPVIGTVARLADQKRLDRLLRVLAALPSPVHCLLAGDGPERPALEALARELAVEDRVRMPGHREDVADVLAAMDLFVLTSRTEGMSNAMLEALAAGVPVVSTAVSGAREALDPFPDGTAPGRVVAHDDEAIRASVAELLEDGEGRARMAGAAKRRARERFDAAGKAEGWERLLTGREGADDLHEGPSALDDPRALP